MLSVPLVPQSLYKSAFFNKISQTPLALKFGWADQKAAAAPAAFGVEQLVPLKAPLYACVVVLVGAEISGHKLPEFVGP